MTRPLRAALTLACLTLVFPARGGVFIDDASGLDRTEIARLVRPRSEPEIREALAAAAAEGLKVTIAGARHSMGGQTLGPGRLVLDMTAFNAVSYDTATEIVTAQSGARWADVLRVLDPIGRSVGVMQSDRIFTIGGALSVNAHGWQAKRPPMISSVDSFRLMLSSGQVVVCSRTENAELFRAAAGGYGLLGVILDARLRTVPNGLYRRRVTDFPAEEFPERFARAVDVVGGAEMAYGRLSIDAGHFLTEASLHAFTPVSPQPTTLRAMNSEPIPWLARSVFQAEEKGDAAKRRRWFLEKKLDAAQNGGVVTRNTLLNNDIGAYWPPPSNRRDILQEYFIPRGKYGDFVAGLRRLIPGRRANLLNVTLRDVRRDDDTALNYARNDSFAFVMFFSQAPTSAGEEHMRELTGRLVDLAESLGGTFYLPYRLHYTPAQMRFAYPGIDAFSRLKSRYDPGELFSSLFWEHLRR